MAENGKGSNKGRVEQVTGVVPIGKVEPLGGRGGQGHGLPLRVDPTAIRPP